MIFCPLKVIFNIVAYLSEELQLVGHDFDVFRRVHDPMLPLRVLDLRATPIHNEATLPFGRPLED
jgi:hypothetical protein